MKKALITLVAAASLLTACHHNDEPTPQEPPEQVVFMYMPWAGSNIYPYFLRNIAGMRQAITDMQGGGKKQVLVLIADNGSRAHLIHLKYGYQKKEKEYNCVNDTIETLQYLNGQSFYSAEGMANMFNKAKAAMPANSYSLIVGCHSMGWLPIDARTDYAKPMFAPSFSKYHNDNEGTPIDREILTRYIGDGVHEDYMAEIPTVATAIRNSFGHMDYILFDDCYMMNIEVAYDLKDVTNYLIASSCEVMIEGMPYNKIGRYLLTGDYEQVVNEFYTHYSAYRNPYGTLAVTKTSEVEQLASVMRQINATHEWVPDSIRTVQRLDGFNPIVFFDMKSYVKRLCADDATLFNQFEQQLSRAVPYAKCTQRFFSARNQRAYNITEFSGITISDPSFSYATRKKEETAWWKATHTD